jgi:hypothetical protein
MVASIVDGAINEGAITGFKVELFDVKVNDYNIIYYK